MARGEAYAVVLADEERAELEHRAACYTLPHKRVQRAKLVLYAAAGATNAEIARRLEMNADVVGRWRKRFHEERLEGLEDRARAGRPRRFPPEEVAQVKAIACELPARQGLPLSRFSRAELHRFVVERAVSEASASTIGRWLAEDAIKPWQQRSWIFPRDPDFLEKAGRVLDLYQGRWQGRLLEPGDMVICADAKPSIQARKRIHPTAPPAPGGGQLVEHEYERLGAVTYLDAWDVRRGRVMGRTEPKGGIAAFDRLVWQVMTKEPYASARRVFWIVDNGSDHRGQRSIERLQRRWRNLILVHLPVHASWLNQVEIYHSIIQRKLLEPNDFADTAALARALNQFERRYNAIAEPFDWSFTRQDLVELLDRLDQRQGDVPLQLAA